MSQRSFAREWTYRLTRFCARLVGVIFFQLRVTGRHNWPGAGGALVCANHQSFLDPVIVGLTCDRRLNYLARETLFRFAPFRWLIKWFDAIPIRREGLGLDGIKETMKRVRRGEMVLIFPEGTRTKTGEMGPIQAGFCAIARRMKAPLVPVGIDGAFDVWPRTSKFPHLAPIHVHIGPPLWPHEAAAFTDEELVAELGRRIAASIREARHSAPRKAN